MTLFKGYDAEPNLRANAFQAPHQRTQGSVAQIPTVLHETQVRRNHRRRQPHAASHQHHCQRLVIFRRFDPQCLQFRLRRQELRSQAAQISSENAAPAPPEIAFHPCAVSRLRPQEFDIPSVEQPDHGYGMDVGQPAWSLSRGWKCCGFSLHSWKPRPSMPDSRRFGQCHPYGLGFQYFSPKSVPPTTRNPTVVS